MTPRIFDIVALKYRISIKYKIRKFFYYGKNYYCLSCGKFLRKFAPFGKIKRDNAECPFCYSLERHRFLLLFLKRKTNLFSGNLKVLDFGPEYYLEIIFKSMSNLEYFSADINPKIGMFQMDITDIKFDRNTFDFILCIGVLEHVIDDKKALKELFRVLKPGGYAIILVPINYNLNETIEYSKEEFQKNGAKYHMYDFHVRDYGLDFEMRLKKAGFNTERITYGLEIQREKRIRYGLIEDEEFYFSQKPIENSSNRNELSKFKKF
ncbi:MAG: class I SAM-dependent methyltransferase [Candidatus Lokiarchaeota archaeon]|nr:class I SAM-dependent methyltransferase [Candidatus Lokiarchaeota archaeon]